MKHYGLNISLSKPVDASFPADKTPSLVAGRRISTVSALVQRDDVESALTGCCFDVVCLLVA